MNKEYRVFVVEASHPDLYKMKYIMSGYSIDNWHFDKDGNEETELQPDAKIFIDIAEKEGRVYSLVGFMFAFNIDEEITANDYVFITNKY